VENIRSADGIGLFVTLGVIYFILNIVSRAAKKAKASGEGAIGGQGASTGAQPEVVSLESILRQIETVKRQKPQGPMAANASRQAPRFAPTADPPRLRAVVQDARGPLGRISKTRLPSAEEVEDRTSLEEEGRLVQERRLQNVEVFAARPERVIQDRDAEAEVIAQRRIKSAESRNRPLAAVDHSRFDRSIRAAETAAVPPPRMTGQGLRDAFIWREILGPPRSLQDD
jgi:hypothetical protein